MSSSARAAALRRAASGQLGGELDVVGDGEVVEQVEELEDHADPFAAEPGQGVLARAGRSAARPRSRCPRSACPGRRRGSAAWTCRCRRGPVTARASPWATESVERSERGRAGVVVALGHALQFDHCGHGRCPSCTVVEVVSLSAWRTYGRAALRARRPGHRHAALRAEEPAAGSSLRSTPRGQGRAGRSRRTRGRARAAQHNVLGWRRKTGADGSAAASTRCGRRRRRAPLSRRVAARRRGAGRRADRRRAGAWRRAIPATGRYRSSRGWTYGAESRPRRLAARPRAGRIEPPVSLRALGPGRAVGAAAGGPAPVSADRVRGGARRGAGHRRRRLLDQRPDLRHRRLQRRRCTAGTGRGRWSALVVAAVLAGVAFRRRSPCCRAGRVPGWCCWWRGCWPASSGSGSGGWRPAGTGSPRCSRRRRRPRAGPSRRNGPGSPPSCTTS